MSSLAARKTVRGARGRKLSAGDSAAALVMQQSSNIAYTTATRVCVTQALHVLSRKSFAGPAAMRSRKLDVLQRRNSHDSLL